MLSVTGLDKDWATLRFGGKRGRNWRKGRDKALPSLKNDTQIIIKK